MPSQNELRTQLTSQILAALDDGVAPWKRPWSNDRNCGRPTNAVTGKPYNGINILLLSLHSHEYRSEGKYFATYKQWQSLGGQVMARPSGVPKGKWAAKGILYKAVTKTKTNSRGEEVEDTFCFMREFSLFNIDQVEGGQIAHLRPGYCDETDPEVSIREADELIENAGIDIFHGGNKAFYEPGIDAITMPHKHQFDGTAYFETLFHEAAHWAIERLKMKIDNDHNRYAMEELVAEMSSCFMCSELGIPLAEGLENHAAYVGNWAKKLHDAVDVDPSFILKASTQASKVCDYLLQFRPAPAEEAAVTGLQWTPALAMS